MVEVEFWIKQESGGQGRTIKLEIAGYCPPPWRGRAGYRLISASGACIGATALLPAGGEDSPRPVQEHCKKNLGGLVAFIEKR